MNSSETTSRLGTYRPLLMMSRYLFSKASSSSSLVGWVPSLANRIEISTCVREDVCRSIIGRGVPRESSVKSLQVALAGWGQ